MEQAIGRRLKELRLRHRLSQRQLARQSGVVFRSCGFLLVLCAVLQCRELLNRRALAGLVGFVPTGSICGGSIVPPLLVSPWHLAFYNGGVLLVVSDRNRVPLHHGCARRSRLARWRIYVRWLSDAPHSRRDVFRQSDWPAAEEIVWLGDEVVR